ncbi:MAG: hypothetical protein RLY16_2621 [Bacteroidota bacterium]
MKPNLLLPNNYKKVGWCLFFPSFLFGLFLLFSDYEIAWLQVKMISIFPHQLFGEKKYFTPIQVNLTYTLVACIFIIGSLLVGFSKEKNEDEFIATLRLSSLLWAVLLNYILLLLAFMLIYDMAFFDIMIYNMFTVILIFIGRFNYVLYKNSKASINEK